MVDKPKILAYIIRHGTTDMSPKSEGWSAVGLDELGKAQARVAGEFVKKQDVKPDFAVSSDLARAVQTCDIACKALGITRILKPMSGLRAFADGKESQQEYEARTDKAFTDILSAAKAKGLVPLVVWHRSGTAWLGKKYSFVHQKIDYRQASLVWEGGVLVLDENGVRPLYKVLTENPKENMVPEDGTTVSGFVTIRDNQPPRECGNCKWMDVYHCDHPVVTADDEIGLIYGIKRNSKGKWEVPVSACCNHFQNKIVSLGGTESAQAKEATGGKDNDQRGKTNSGTEVSRRGDRTA